MGHYDDLYEFYKNKPIPLCMPKLTKIKSVKKLEQTNEEWFCSLSTEEKAEVFFAWMDAVNQQNRNGEHITNKETIIQTVILKWLKEKHNVESSM